MHVDEESGSGLKKRRGSMSSRQSLKSFDNNNKASEEGKDSLYLLIIILKFLFFQTQDLHLVEKGIVTN